MGSKYDDALTHLELIIDSFTKQDISDDDKILSEAIEKAEMYDKLHNKIVRFFELQQTWTGMNSLEFKNIKEELKLLNIKWRI